jgi:hypothetical protein
MICYDVLKFTEDVSLMMKVPYTVETRDGKRYATVSKVDVKFSSNKSNMRVVKLNSGNAIALGESIDFILIFYNFS